MNLHGSNLDFPLRPDVRGTVATRSDRSGIISQAIADLIETRRGERVMMPDYGLPDFIFSVMDLGFAARLAYHLEEQILKYVPLVASVTIATVADGEGRAEISLTYTEVGEIASPKNLVFPIWQYLPETAV